MYSLQQKTSYPSLLSVLNMSSEKVNSRYNTIQRMRHPKRMDNVAPNLRLFIRSQVCIKALLHA